MRAICEELNRRGYDLSRYDALEFFAREGDWQTLSYADRVRSVEAWEIDPAYEEGLRRNLPQAVIRIGNSFELANTQSIAVNLALLSLITRRAFTDRSANTVNTLRRLKR